MSLTIYGVAASRAFRTLWAARELGLAYDHVPHHYAGPEVKAAPYLAINPMGAVPAIVDEAIAMTPRPKVLWMQLTIRHDEAAAKAEAAGMTVIMDRCPKIEYGRLAGENSWAGINSRVIDSRRPAATVEYQRFRLPGVVGGK